VSHLYGFGLMDAEAMVKEAERWKTVPRQHICVENTDRQTRIIRPEHVIRSVYKATGCADNPNHHVIYLEHVVVRVTIIHPRRGDLAIYLTSPSGTKSQLLANRYCRRSTETNLFFKKWFLFVSWGPCSSCSQLAEVYSAPPNMDNVRTRSRHGFFLKFARFALCPINTACTDHLRVRIKQLGNDVIYSQNDFFKHFKMQRYILFYCASLYKKKKKKKNLVCTETEMEDHRRWWENRKISGSIDPQPENLLGLRSSVCVLMLFYGLFQLTFLKKKPCYQLKKKKKKFQVNTSDNNVPRFQTESSTKVKTHFIFPSQCRQADGLQGTKCVVNCNNGTYYNAHKKECEYCHWSCAACSGMGAEACTKCAKGFYMEDWRCVMSCSHGYYLDQSLENGEKTCRKCDASCFTCSGPGEKNCTGCSSGYNLDANVCVVGTICKDDLRKATEETWAEGSFCVLVKQNNLCQRKVLQQLCCKTCSLKG
uniref:Proprotein convertase subtilisin/kexin type 5b n=1 Tax=Latimeria chalumnae TaxID=7897 RepID=H3APK0_LATCH